MNAPVQVPEIDPTQAAALADRHEVLLLDVREPHEWEGGHAPQALHTSLGTLDPSTVPRDRPVVAVCRSGNRSGTAALQLAAAGIQVSNMAGGMGAWVEAGLPIVRSDGTAGEVL